MKTNSFYKLNIGINKFILGNISNIRFNEKNFNPCFRGEIKGKEEKISPVTPEEEAGASLAFDSAETSSSVAILQETPSETRLSVVENVGEYEVVKSIFGKEKVRKIK